MKFDFSIHNYQAILFDFDGVLAECMDVKTEAFAQLFEEFGNDIVKKVVNHHIENGGISRYKKIQYYYSDFLNKEISKDKVNQIAQKFSDLVVKKVIESDWVKGAKEFLEKYISKLDFYVVSGTPQEELDLIIKKRDMGKYFKEIYGSPKTKAEIANIIIEESNYDKKKVLYIGDSLSDYKNAMEANIQFLGRVPKNMDSYFPKNTPYITEFTDIL
jgi:HAD superfamily hydrolase (TIGR01549 family)